jgi:hypothetical protein
VGGASEGRRRPDTQGGGTPCLPRTAWTPAVFGRARPEAPPPWILLPPHDIIELTGTAICGDQTSGDYYIPFGGTCQKATVTFTPGQLPYTKIIAVSIKRDSVVEAPKTVTMTIATGSGYDVRAPAWVTKLMPSRAGGACRLSACFWPQKRFSVRFSGSAACILVLHNVAAETRPRLHSRTRTQEAIGGIAAVASRLVRTCLIKLSYPFSPGPPPASTPLSSTRWPSSQVPQLAP